MYKDKRRQECLLVADCIARILSRVNVDHIIFQNTSGLEDIYMMCAQINAIQTQYPIHIYFPGSIYSEYYYHAADPCRPLQLKLHSDRNNDSFLLNLRLNFRKTDVGGEQVGEQVVRYTEHPSNEDSSNIYKMMTLHMSLDNVYDDPSLRFQFRLRESQGLSLEDFPSIEVIHHCDYHYYTTEKMCRILGITSDCDWPAYAHRLRELRNEDTVTRDTKSACFDSRISQRSTPLNANDEDPYSMLNLSESLNKISPEVGLPQNCVTVAVLDTGILACHDEFLNKIVAMKNFVPNEANDLCYDFHGHGTSCAGILLRTAPFVRLVICKVMSSQGHGQLKWAADAIDWLLNDETGPKNYCPVDIISMSFGCTSFDSDLRRAVSDAIGLGKVVVAAASNDGRKKLTNIAFPARFGDVICVGSCNNLGQPSSFTPTGREIDFLAPGENIPATLPPPKSGTSEATPMVAGIAAMVISYAETVGGQTMRATVSHTAVMREILRKMASMPGHHDEHMGYGNLDPMRLFKYGPDHFRQVVEEIVGPLPTEAQSQQPVNTRKRKRRASDSEVHEMKACSH